MSSRLGARLGLCPPTYFVASKRTVTQAEIADFGSYEDTVANSLAVRTDTDWTIAVDWQVAMFRPLHQAT
jgi:hypothetical protein